VDLLERYTENIAKDTLGIKNLGRQKVFEYWTENPEQFEKVISRTLKDSKQ
jgi:hypothetical protein